MTNLPINYIINDIMKKLSAFTVFAAAFLFFTASPTFSQEALKSTEEEYFDFLSLLGITERPTLNYRTLSDSEWNIKNSSTEIQALENTEESTEKNQPETTNKTEEIVHPWQNNNLGTKRTFWASASENTNWFTKGINRSVALKIYGPEWFNSYNTAAPYGQNDGALWQGKGYNTSLTAGARLEAFGFELTVKPQVSFSQNLEFDYMPGVYGSKYSYFWAGNIDLVQRYGDTAFWNFDWGDTELRWSWHTFTIGFGFQSPWLGPAWLNPMLGSNNAGTYPKIDIGLRRTKLHLPWLGWYIGDIEGRVWCGKLSESDYFDNDSSNDENFITGFSVAYNPSFLKGLSFSINKICLTKWNDKSIEYLNPFYNSNNNEDQKASFGIDWIFPQVGFKIYGELGIDDYNGQGFANPFHTAIYTIGVKKEFLLWNKHHIYGELIFEWNNFEMSQDFQLQWEYMGYYSHSIIKQGYTNRGQIIGAGSGYFGNSQYFGIKIYYPKGSISPFIHFNRPDTNYINNKAVSSSTKDWKDLNPQQSPDWANYKAIRTIGANFEYFITKNFILSGEFNSSYIIKTKYNSYDKNITNFYALFCIKYNF